MTAMSEGMLMIVCLALVLTTQVFKRRIYWTGSSYLMMTFEKGKTTMTAALKTLEGKFLHQTVIAIQTEKK